MTKQPSSLSPITPKQQEILKQLYRYRFLNRTQIQTLLNHKHKGRILSWLKDLRDKKYIDWHYNPTDFALKTKPAIYYLSLNGIRHLRQTDVYPAEELRKRYKESTRKQSYIDKCLLIAECCITLQANSVDDVGYSFHVESDYIDPESDYDFLNELHPDLYFTKQDGDTTQAYLLELFDSITPRYAVKKKLSDYVEYLIDEEWREHTQSDESPVVLLAFESTAELLYAKRRLRRLLEDEPEEVRASVRFATYEKVYEHGVTGRIWEEI